ncbi:MAG: hypothetical protein ABJD11_03530 [Gemmatimonadota bacterium]
MNALSVFIPITFLCVAVTGIIASSILKIQRLRLEEARLRAGDPAELEDLATRTATLERELAEVHERLDFAERILAQTNEKAGLPPARRPL